jgi:tetratricopeptide (TPR) repeat protein
MTIRGLGRRTTLAATILLWLLAAAVAEDTVTIAGSSGGRSKLTGRVLDYTGRELKFEHPDGRQQSFPAEKVLAIDTQYGQYQTEADARFAAARYDQALELYRRAIDDEERRWVRRQIIAQVVRCYSALDQPDRAGEAFLLLIRDDPDTPYFDCIPLAWLPREPSLATEQAAQLWLRREEPAAVLLGASHLLTGSARPAALAELRRLTTAADRRIAQLALAQTWRAALATVDDEQVQAWSRTVEKMPERLAAGPYLLLGSAYYQRQQWPKAALALLRVAILYPEQRPLAAQALLDAGRSLEKLDRPKEALGLYRELIQTYPQETRPVAEAQGRMEAMMKDH